MMRAWFTTGHGDLESASVPVPEPGPDEVRVRVLACGVCRTDLHVRDGELPPHQARVVPGHEIVGEVVGGTGHPIGSRVGIPWLRHTCGVCKYCRSGAENLCPYSRYTGWDANGGYADYAVVPSTYAYQLPAGYSDEELAPLLCAGIIGFRAWRRTEVPPGGRLGIYGFGGSAHLTAQVAVAAGATVHVFTRAPAARELALSLGAASAQDSHAPTPEPLDGAILFAPVGDLVPAALRALDRGGRLAIAGIYLSTVPPLDYEETLFYEREVRSVTANTRTDGREFLAFAAKHRLELTISPYPLDRAAQALDDLASDRVNGVAVLHP